MIETFEISKYEKTVKKKKVLMVVKLKQLFLQDVSQQCSLTMENINESKNNDFFNTHKSTPLLKPNILNLQQVKIQMKLNDVNHYSVKTLS